ncbi:DUF2510 domain-containing protein [Curtobacterium sp. YC1]|uniref:DUF2510 domain-containing protein n=1 Tax=Curtobacterium sp. YC1 TaxID=2795488 RepID=UPI0018E54562|nr:DUF2510 domain-containing protein [Curtobacterium sp. YC1]QQD75762.1 DUF2510 domain-containing protein [Curtobacterium sp. YC1]
MTLPAAGWFPDPQNADRLRWWDGRTWGDETRVTAARVEAVVPMAVAPAGPSFSVQTAPLRADAWSSGDTSDRRLCVLTVIAVLLAAVSLVVNPWGVTSLLALAAGVLGVARPGVVGAWAVVARSAAASAVVIAVTTAIIAASGQFHLF